uniref:Uncharacterized protein n=1 Tax=Arundo donax TaxID=35708 RepID=A0A0A8ZM11_ARUDO
MLASRRGRWLYLVLSLAFSDSASTIGLQWLKGILLIGSQYSIPNNKTSTILITFLRTKNKR